MERIAFHLLLNPGMQEEYKRLHDEIWPELLDLMTRAGISNYTIWNTGEHLFGYHEVQDRKFADELCANSPISHKWSQAMEKIIHIDIDPETGKQREMKLMFAFNLSE